MADFEESSEWEKDQGGRMDESEVNYEYNLGQDFISAMSMESMKLGPESEKMDFENLKFQLREFGKACGEMMVELGKGCRDVVRQSVFTEDSVFVRNIGPPIVRVFEKLRFLNEYLPEDRDPVHAWSVIFVVFILTFAVLMGQGRYESPAPPREKMSVHPPSASRIRLSDGRYLAYRDAGVPLEKARFSIIVVHSFLSSRLAGIPGVKDALLEEYGVRLVSYDLPGFGESDPHPERTLNSSAFDMLQLADSLSISNSFWVFSFSSSSLHAFAALYHIPHRVAGVALFGPMVNPYDPSLTKAERQKIRKNLTPRRKLMLFIARRFPVLLPFLYRRTFLSGDHGEIDQWLSISLEKKDRYVVRGGEFEEFWRRDVEESIRQRSPRPLVEEARLHVSNWGSTLTQLRPVNKCRGKGAFPWLSSIYGSVNCIDTGFSGPIHIWQGTEDGATPAATTEYLARVLPGAVVHRITGEGHFSFLYFCDKCHLQVFSTLFSINPA